MVLGLLLSIAVRNKSLTFIQSSLILSSFALYPAATLLFGVIVGLLIFKYNKTLANPLPLLSVALLFLVAVVSSIFRARSLLESLGLYFDIFGKSNNTSYRLSLVDAALIEIDDRPIFGTFFRGSATVRANVLDNRNFQLPVHNDYITFVLCGGFACLALLLIMILTLHFRIMVTCTQMSDDRSRVISALMGSTYVLLASAFANPVLINPGNSTIFYVIVMTMIALTPSKDKKSGKIYS
jgi:O-antigen ligase